MERTVWRIDGGILCKVSWRRNGMTAVGSVMSREAISERKQGDSDDEIVVGCCDEMGRAVRLK